MWSPDYEKGVFNTPRRLPSPLQGPYAPWELRMEIARQCWDESRHARLYHRRLLEKGGRKGEFPIANHEWTVTCSFATLA